MSLFETPIAHAASEEGISIALKAKPLFEVAGITVTNTLTLTILVVVILCIVGILIGKSVKKIPSKTQAFFEMIFAGALNYIEEVLESRELALRYFPLLATLFFFILLSNWLGIIPGIENLLFSVSHDGHSEYVHFFQPVNTDLNTPLALAFISFFVIEFAGVTALGVLKYGSKFVNFKSVMGFFVGLIELISELARLITFSFRLFGNMFAGKVLLTVLVFFMPLFLPVPLLAYELGVGLIQAAVFALLTLFFIKLAVSEPH